MRRVITTLLLGAAFLAACGNEATNDPADVPSRSGSTITDGLPLVDDDATFPAGMGPGISVADALVAPSGEPLLVNGYVFVYADGSIVFADQVAESFPPQPAGAQVTVTGLDLLQVPLTEGPSDSGIAIIAWTDTPVQLIGEITDGVFVGNSVASA